MSPTEFELRAALRDGEGGDCGTPLDVDSIIGHAESVRRQRRGRLLGGATAAVVVAGVGVTGAVLAWGGGSGSSPASPSRPNGQVYGAMNDASPSAEGLHATNGSAVAADCPAAVPRLNLPGGGGTGQFGADDAVFARSVTRVLVCAYGSQELVATSGAAPAGTVLSGTDATTLAGSLNDAAAPTSGAAHACPDFRTADGPQEYVLIGYDSSGAALPAVVVTLGDNPCLDKATNGTAVRPSWSPPASLQATFSGLAAKVGTGPPRVQPSGNTLPTTSHS